MFRTYTTIALALLILASCSTLSSDGVPPAALHHSYFHDGVRIHFREIGAGRPVVLIHGFAASLDTWRYLEDALKQEYRLILLDLKGHGYSERPRDDRYSLQDHAAIVLGLMEHLKVENAVLVGNSFGCAVALMAALKDQENDLRKVSGLVLIAGTVDPDNLPFYVRLLRLPLLGWLTVKLTPAALGSRVILHRAYYNDEKITESLVQLYAAYQRIPGTDHALLTTARQMVPPDLSDLREKLERLNVPVLKIIGKHDRIISRQSSESVCQIVPDCRAVVMDEVGHVPHEEKPDELIPLVRGFMSKPARY